MFKQLYNDALKQGDYRQLYMFGQSTVVNSNPDKLDGECLWMTARANRLYAYNHTDKETDKLRLITEGFELSKKAIEKDDNNWAAHKWYAIMLGDFTEISGSQHQLKASSKIREHMEKAAELNPEDATTFYSLGLWHYSFASMSWLTRNVARMIFPELPETDYGTALEYFERAEEMDPGFYSMNWLYLAKCYQVLGHEEMFKVYRKKLVKMKPIDDDDRNAVKEARRMKFD